MELNLFLEFIGNCLKEINSDIEKLRSNRYNNNRNVLDHLSGEVIMLENHIKYFSQSNQLGVEEIPHPYQRIYAHQVPPDDNATRFFTLDELALYDGKNGNPAYVAVNGVVYDVTNNAAWAAATHFGNSAGNDLTNAFAACHPRAMVLSALPIVGYLS